MRPTRPAPSRARRAAGPILACALLGLLAGGESPTQGAELEVHELRGPAGQTRRYHLHRPARAPRGPLPLVLVLHGGGGDGPSAARMTGFNQLSDREGFLVAYPDGTGRLGLLTWNAGPCCAHAMREGVDDVGFLGAVMDDLVASGAADPARLYVTGMSNGAMMAHRLGRELSPRIAAIAPVVGAVFGGEPAPARPVSALIINGLRDEVVPSEGGWSKRRGLARRRVASAPYAPAGAQLTYWADADRCQGRPAIDQTSGPGDSGFIRYAYARCAEGTEAVAYLLRENGHAWPGGRKGRARADAPARDFDASAVIWRFFKDKRKPPL